MSSPAEEPGGASLTVAADLVAVRDLAAFLREACAAAGVSDMAALDLELAMVEAATNVVEHGYEGRSLGDIELTISLDPENAVLVLSDSGAPVPDGTFSQCRQVSLDALDGRGIGIVQSCVDAIDYASSDGRNHLRLTKRLT